MPKKAAKSQNPRLAAIRALSDVLDAHLNLAESQAFQNLRDSRDIALAKHLAYGVLRWLGALEWLAEDLLSKPIKKREKAVKRLLLLGLHQLWHDQTADHAAINETAECARLLGKPWAVGLINAVLRRFQRERESILNRLDKTPQCYAHPDWLLQAIKRDWPDHWRSVVEANNRQAPMWMRINRRRANETVLLKDLEQAGFETCKHPYAGDALAISPAAPVEAIPHFSSGWLSVQDPAAQLARDLINPCAGDRILDACAAPGGKTAHLLESCEDLALLALDKQASRVKAIQLGLERLGLVAQTMVADASKPGEWSQGQMFNKVLLDAPCSATGVIRRHPEIKWLRDLDQVHAAVDAQSRLLDALWSLLEAGGMLVYATCSVLEVENATQIKLFLNRHPEAKIEDPVVEWGIAGPYGRQVLPGDAQMDGFFYAVLRKSA